MIKQVLLAAAIVTMASPAMAQDVSSADWAMPGCRAASITSNAEEFRQGFCMGMARILLTYNRGFGACAPPAATVGQTTQVITLYIESHPKRAHEPFEVLAIEALRAAWPCKRAKAVPQVVPGIF